MKKGHKTTDSSGLTKALEDKLTGIRQHNSALLAQSMLQAFEAIRPQLASRLLECLKNSVPDGPSTDSQKPEQWEPIESMSKLRALVGGRFQNIKAKWTKAGLPVKEHKGDLIEEIQVNEKGWVELSNWILKQGYEARLGDQSKGILLELRKAS